jgi:NAD-dependent deacetylase
MSLRTLKSEMNELARRRRRLLPESTAPEIMSTARNEICEPPFAEGTYFAVATDTEQLIELIRERGRVTAFTGAGISTESGLPDYRGPDGVWRYAKPVTFQEFEASPEGRAAYWAYKAPVARTLGDARPNRAHEALARLHAVGTLTGVITQNIDGLHQAAGLPPEAVIELHGNNTITRCLDCGHEIPTVDAIAQMDDAAAPCPRCDQCGGDRLKPATVSFGQSLNENDLRRSQALAENCGVFLVVGSSLTVSPANTFPLVAAQHGAVLAIVNQGATPLDAQMKIRIDGAAGDILGAVAEELAPQ